LAAGTALAVPKGDTVALDVFSAILEELKADATVRRTFDKHGLRSSTDASAGSRS
jgi:hypothetical protein